MIDEKAVGLMTRLAIYEKKQQHKDIPVSRFYKTDYVRFNALKSIVAVTFAYWLVIGLYVYLKFEDILEMLNEIDYFDLMYKILGTYAIICVIYFFFSSIVYYIRYELARPGLTDYNSNLRELIEVKGGPSHYRKPVKGKVVKQAVIEEKPPVKNTDNAPKTTRPQVNRVAILQQKQAETDREREKQILENVKQRNERIALQNEQRLAEQRKREMQQRAVREKREQLEKEQLMRLRAENGADAARNDYSYKNDANSEGGNL